MDIDQMPDGFGASSQEELAELRKALEIGYTQPATGTDGLRVESLDSTLKLLTYQAQHIKLWNQIGKSDAYSTIEEYNQLSSYGSTGGGFVASGELPPEDDSTYARANQQVKYIGTTRAVHHPATLIRSVPADLIGQETQNGALWIMGKANSALYYGDGTGVPLEWNGLIRQLVDGSGNILDMGGAALAPIDVEEAAQLIATNFGQPTKLYSSLKVLQDFSNTYAGNQRFLAPNAPAGTAGTPINGYNTIVGKVDFEPDVFVKEGGVVPTAATSVKAPVAPTLSLANPGATTGSKWKAGDAGNVKYQVTAVNNYGESLPCVISAATAVTTGESLTLTITDGGGAYPATAYKVYRTDAAGTIAYFIGVYTPRTKTGSVYQATTSFPDLNEWRPKCYIAVVADMSVQAWQFKQLAPMLKMNLAVISPAIRWMQLLYGTPIIYAPKKLTLIKNIRGVTV